MKKIIRHLLPMLMLLFVLAHALQGQNSPNCATATDDNFLTGRAFFNYGSASNSFNTQYRANITVGQPVVGTYFGQLNKGSYGFWARFLLPPAAPTVLASEGDLEDRVQVDWNPDPLSPAATGYKIYRNGSLLASVDGETFSFLDFNVIAGKFYTYEVSGVNTFGEGSRGSSLGFLNPNGVVTGQVQSFSSNPVPGAIVTLSPTLGAAANFDGTDDMAFSEYNPVYPRNEFTLSCWIKLNNGNNNAGIIDLGSNASKNWWLHTLPTGQNGVKIAIGGSSVTELSHAFPSATANDWHHVAATYNGSSLLLYVDGELIETAVGDIESDSIPLFFGKDGRMGTNFYNGKLDEVRLFDRQLSQTELQMFMNRTVPANMDGLVNYWKFDEGVGSKAFDQAVTKQKVYFCGATWTTDKPNVVNSGVTDETGFYEIAGINYGPGQTFTATASKSFYFNQSLEFNAANGDYADLTNFDLADSASLTLFVKGFDFSGSQAIVSKADAGGNNLFMVGLNNGNVEMTVGSEMHDFGPLEMGFHHLAFTLLQNGSSLTVDFYKDGSAVGSHTFGGATDDVSAGLPWKLGAKASGPSSHSNHFTGLVDEVAFFNTLLSLADIQEFANIGTNVANAYLVNYFNLNEGAQTTLHDMGTGLTGNGTVYGADWSTVAAIEETLPHEFTPSTRLVTLNPSNTAIDQVDFVDQSTIPVSGYVRFDGTTCFAEGVEILVNGFSYVPAIKTDSDGYFSADFEPGATIRLTPKFENHTFYPAFWDLPTLNAPVAGILFRDQTKRKVVGQLAGGHCRKSVIPAGSIVRVKVATLDGCYERIQELENPNGKFVFNGVPPDSVTVAVIEHSNPVIYNYLQNLGGATLDLKVQDDTVDFIYLAPPNVEMTALDTNACGDPMLNMLQNSKVTIKVYEDYDGGRCYLDTALLTIDNQIAHLDQFDTLMTEGSLVHRFRVEEPNIVAPYLKTLQVTAEAHDELATATQSAVILGRRPRQTTFTSTAPEIPTLILRDPPGDASSAYMSSGETVCQNWSFSAASSMDINNNVTISLGPDIETTMGTPFFSTALKVDVKADLGYEINASTTSYSSNSMETCVTTSKTISTGSNDLIVGSEMGGDVYMGGAMNFIFGITDELLWDTMNCDYILDKGLYVFPDGFNTTFLYTEHHILTSVIPNLLTIGDTLSAERWQDIIDRNNQLKEEAVFSQNLSFDAGITYEESESTDVSQSTTYGWTQSFSAGFAAEFGVNVNGLGISAGLAMNWGTEKTSESSTTTTTSRTVGFTLADDDIGDNFTVNVKKDKVYGTPVFELVSGQTQCPHEPNTQPREGVSMTIDKLVAVNTPMNAPATFIVTVGNISQSNEPKGYTLALLQESNPQGAIVKFNGQLTSIPLYIYPGAPVTVTMTIERGPIAFDYTDLVIYVTSDCEYNRSGILNTSLPEYHYQQFEVDAYFLEPCSEVDVAFPLQDWVLIPADGNILNITTSYYDVMDPDLELIRVQYRRSQGDGAWINIAEIDKADLGPVFEITPWNTDGLQDGFYEIRAVTQCFSGALNPGISHVVKGKIERTPPEIFGTPQPADGVLESDDEISITFTEPIRCDVLIQADFFQNNNVGLYNTRTDELVDANVTCSGDKITIVPNVPNMFIENEILRVEIDSIRDLANNYFDHTSWEFFVDRNSLRWAGTDIEEVIYEGNALTVSRPVENISGAAVNYAITGIPDWVEVLPSDGTLPPGATQVVTFKFKETLPRGEYLDTIYLETALGDEPLVLDVRVLCEGPEWEIDPSQYNFTMNFTVELDIEGEVSDDNMDQVAAFVGSELRGMAYLQYEPAVDKYLAFLTVYSNSVTGETLDFQIWDADMCLLYGEVVESFTFSLDGLVGSPLVPQVLHTNNQLLRKIPVHPGWNWISFNLDAPDKGIGPMLSSLQHPEGGLVKSQSQFSQYHTGLSQWLGSLTTLGYKSMYQYQAPQHDTILLVGARILPDTVNIPVNVGWNWIGYLPNTAMHPDEALASLTPLNGDVVKSQTSFAQFVAGQGWIGNLDFLSAPNGYLLKISNPGVLSYPQQSGGTVPGSAGMLAAGGLPQRDLEDGGTSFRTPDGPSATIWTVDPALFEHSMNMVAVVGADANLLEAGDVVGAFAGDEVRGGSEAVFVEPLQAWLVFLTAYANTEGETLTFKYYDASAEDIHRLNETVVFAADQVAGSVEAPQVLTLQEAGTATEEALRGNWMEAYPNPAGDHLFAAFGAAGSGTATVRITDSMGRTVKLVEVETVPGLNVVRWDCAGAAGGSYFVTVTSGGNTVTKRVVKK